MASHAVYSRRNLSIYDAWVHGFSNRWAWKCPTTNIVQLYDENMSANHMDAGVGTGYFLDRCRVAKHARRIALMDRHPDALRLAARRIARYQPETYQQNVLEPFEFQAAAFDSIGCNYLLHCLPGSLEAKCSALDHLKKLMNPQAVLFGSTILHEDVPCNWLAKRLIQSYNRRGIFSNDSDGLPALQHELQQRFDEVRINLVGCVALFSAQ